MNSWTSDELTKIGASDELKIVTLRGDGTHREPTTVWVVHIADDIYVRSVKGKSGKWFARAEESHEGRITAGGVTKDVAVENAPLDVTNEIDAAYKSKYDRYGDRVVGTVLTPDARSATLKLTPKY